MNNELDQACIFCFGCGTQNDEPCRACDGYGHTLTYDGRKLIEFLQRRGVAFPMSPLAEDELRGMAE